MSLSESDLLDICTRNLTPVYLRTLCTAVEVTKHPKCQKNKNPERLIIKKEKLHAVKHLIYSNFHELLEMFYG